MYKPQDMERPQYPMFKKVNGRIISFLSLKAALAIGAATVFAVVLALVLGIPCHDATVPTTDMDQLEARTLLQAERAAAAIPAVEKEIVPLRSASGVGPKGDLTADETQLYNDLSQELSRYRAVLTAYSIKTESELRDLAVENGITRATTDTQIQSMVPLEKIESQQIVSVPVRWAVAIAMIGLAFMLFSELGDRSLASKIELSRRYASSQHVYKYKRGTGSHYEGQEAMR